MTEPQLTGKAQTVLGPIPAEDLGITLPHEHLIIDDSSDFIEPTAASEKVLAYQPVSIDNLHWVRNHFRNNLDNLILSDVDMAIKEASRYRNMGGNTIVELTCIGAGRDPTALRHIASATGLNIIMGAAYFTAETHPEEVITKSEQELAEGIARDLTDGVGDTGIRAGIIGEVGCGWPLADNERKVLRAVAIAQQLTGAPVNIHPGRHPDAPFEIIEILRNAGGDISRTVISHSERTIRDYDEICRLAATDCYIEYDLFGWEGYYRTEEVDVDIPNDAQRVREIMRLMSDGYRKILISHDTASKMNLYQFGGKGYIHILENAVPLMRRKGMSEEDINTLMVQNPKCLLQFAQS